MALLFMDGFDANDITSGKWDVNEGNIASTTVTRFGSGYSLRVSSGGNRQQKSFTASSQVTIGIAMYVVDGSSGETTISFRADSAATTHLTLVRDTTSGHLQLFRGNDTGTLLVTGATAINYNTWYYVEFQATIADAGGTAIVRLNGSTTPEINFTGDTKNGGTSTNIDTFTIVNNGSVTTYWDDLYILDSTGSTNNTFLGDVRIHTLSPNGNGNSSQLTGSDGNQIDNYQQVDELPFSSADYNGSATPGNKDTYTISNLPAGVASVFGVQNNMLAAKSDATAASARTVLRTGSTDYTGTTRVLSTSYLNYRDVYDVNPNTTAAWTVSDVDGLEAGMEVV